MEAWTDWQPFPDPRRNQFLTAPFGPGVYELRRMDSEELVIVGSGKNCAFRMTSLLPAPLGQGTRKNEDKRQYVMDHLPVIAYRCCACATAQQARGLEKRLRQDGGYMFPT